MNAVLKDLSTIRPMSEHDLNPVIAVEQTIYPFPWSLGNFRDSLNAGYSCWICESGPDLVGYAVMMVAAGEAHLLNLGIAHEWQQRGMGRQFMHHLINVARDYHATTMLLEVRPSNTAARRLYHSLGFCDLATRRKYYPAELGREDAILMAMSL